VEPEAGACPQQRRLPALVNGSLPAGAATALQSHLSRCPTCQKDEAVYRQITETLRRLPPLAAPPGLREQVVAAAQAGTCGAGDGDRRQTTGTTKASCPWRLSPVACRLMFAFALVAAVGIGVHFHFTRYQGRTAGEWLQAARKAADRSYSLHVVGWVKLPHGVVPVEAWRRAGDLSIRVGSGPPTRRAYRGGPRVLLATWGGEAGRFHFGEPLLFAIERERPVTGSPRFHSRRPLVIALPRARGLEQRVWIDPDTEHVQRVLLVGPNGRPQAALERLEYGLPPFSGVPLPPTAEVN
jgi:hypothetical protein